MDIDNPATPEFASWMSYNRFAQRVRHKRRYVWDDHVKAFIATVLATLRGRDRVLPDGMQLLRAQRGIDYCTLSKDEPEQPTGYKADRMKPRPNQAMEGRANAAGVSVLLSRHHAADGHFRSATVGGLGDFRRTVQIESGIACSRSFMRPWSVCGHDRS